MPEAPYGRGVISQGELIMSPEEDRLVAKKAWLQLWDHYMRHDERLKAARMDAPWDLETDADIARAIDAATRTIAYNFEDLKSYLESDENSSNDLSMIPESFKIAKTYPRLQWIMDKVVTENPKTVLDIGAGWGEIAVEIARLGIHVTALAPFAEGTEHAKSLQEKEHLPIHWIHDIFESQEFEEQFDMVLACEIIEHVIDDEAFLKRAWSLARQALVLTTPYGSVDKGFQIKDPQAVRGQHVRAYSWPSFLRLVAALEPRNDNVLVDTMPSCGGRIPGPTDLPNLDIQFFCLYLSRCRTKRSGKKQSLEKANA